MTVVLPPRDLYQLQNEDQIITPALLIYPEIVETNIRIAIGIAAGDPRRWRPHIKTAKIPYVVKRLIAHGVVQLKCSTTLELLTACQAGAEDVLLAYAVMGANARRVREIANAFPDVRVSVLVETVEQAAEWIGTPTGVFIDLNSGMNRTGMDEANFAAVQGLARTLGKQFRGLHFYDGHMSGVPAAEREARAHAGYDGLMQLVNQLIESGIDVQEIITSGTPAAPWAMTYAGFNGQQFIHRISPGTVVYNDLTSLEQLAGYGFQPAALVLSTVVSRPTGTIVTCDGGHKSVSADAGVPTCAVLGHPELQPAKPSEEHLPIGCASPDQAPALGTKLYLVPRHVCPSVNNFDEALMVRDGRVQSLEKVAARGHENPLLALA